MDLNSAIREVEVTTLAALLLKMTAAFVLIAATVAVAGGVLAFVVSLITDLIDVT